MFRKDDSLFQNRTGRVAPAVARVLAPLNPIDATYTANYLAQLFTLNAGLSCPFDPWFLVGQWLNETDGGTSSYFTVDGNPAGIGIWKSGVESPWFGKLTPEQAATVHLAELLVHVAPLDSWLNSPVYKQAATFDGTHLTAVANLRHSKQWPNVETVANLSTPVTPYDFVWAADQKYGDTIASKLNALYSIPDAKELTAMPINIGNRPLRIAIGAGHHNSNGGNEFETGMTGRAVAKVIELASKSQGFEMRSYTPNNGLGFFPGTLDAAAAQVTQWDKAGWHPDILHELHFEGLDNTSVRGAFVIYPDSAGLVGRNSGNIDLDVQACAGEMARIIASAYGGVTRYNPPRGMSERETGVGEEGWRLGVFGAWAEPSFINNSFVFITEAATYTNPIDYALMNKPTFLDDTAKGVLQAYAYIAKQRGNWTFPYQIGSSVVTTPKPQNLAPDGKPYPLGLDAGLVARWYGTMKGQGRKNGKTISNFVYSWVPGGSVSNAYYRHFVSLGRFPAIVASEVYGQRWYIRYADGSVCWRENDKSSWKFL